MNIVSQQAEPTLHPMTAIQLVLGVARLGERDLRAWWSSQGLNPAVRFALAGFRRTAMVVGAELAHLSAVRRHHQLLPRLTAVHLFSPYLPFAGWTFAYLGELKGTGPDDLLEQLARWTAVEAGQDAIKKWHAKLPAADIKIETVTPADLDDPVVQTGLLKTFVSGYLAAPDDDLTVPYVDLIK
ncbi:MAG: BrxE family protein [Actinomycetota bacterium]